MRTRWTTQRVEDELRAVALTLGRMPSRGELYALGKTGLSSAISHGHCGGKYAYWAGRLGLQQKGSETHRGLAAQAFAAEWLRKIGYVVEEQRTCHPFDLLVNGRVRVDVKSATSQIYKVYKGPRAGRRMRKYSFSTAKGARTCDVYLLCCVSEHRAQRAWYFVPATEVRSGVALTSLRSKWEKYREALEVLDSFL